MTSQQPRPRPGQSPVTPSFRDGFIVGGEERDQVGRERYGTDLETFNGRNAGQDAWEEWYDLGKYLQQMRMEYSVVLGQKYALEDRVGRLHARIAQLEGNFVPGHPDHTRCGGCRG